MARAFIYLNYRVQVFYYKQNVLYLIVQSALHTGPFLSFGGPMQDAVWGPLFVKRQRMDS